MVFMYTEAIRLSTSVCIEVSILCFSRARKVRVRLATHPRAELVLDVEPELVFDVEPELASAPSIRPRSRALYRRVRIRASGGQKLAKKASRGGHDQDFTCHTRDLATAQLFLGAQGGGRALRAHTKKP